MPTRPTFDSQDLRPFFDADSATASAEHERSQIAVELTWNLADLFPTDAAWSAEKERLAADLPQAERAKGTLADSPRNLLDALTTISALQLRMLRLYSYASMRADEDTRESGAQAMRLELQQLATELGAKSSYVDPEILKMERATVERYVAEEPVLEAYRHALDDLLRRQAHTGTEGEERILADAGLMSDGPSSIHELLVDADLPRPEVTLSTGETVALDPSSFAKHRAAPNRDDRRKVFAAYFGRLHEFRRTFGATLDANIKRDVFHARARKYASALESALDAHAIPTSVYENLVAQVNDHLGTFHRYLRLRQRILGVDRLHYSDLYAPLLPEVDLRFTVEEAKAHVVASCAPLGSDYAATVARALAERWIDFLPSTGKRSGAYSNGVAYEVHPFILMNWNGRYDDLTTLAHELGHTLHSYRSNRDQPFPSARYSIFVAEVASTFNEALLLDRMLKSVEGDRQRLSLLGNFLEGVKGTIFRQTQFAEFELEIHRRVERGEALTGDALDALYLALARRYYGHDAGVCLVDDEVASEWAFIPHFYYDFYVYQYATAFTASAALSERVLAGDTAATERYLALLSSGGSDYPVDLLKRAGVDLTTPEPFALAMQKANRVMDEIEMLLGRISAPASDGGRRAPD